MLQPPGYVRWGEDVHWKLPSGRPVCAVMSATLRRRRYPRRQYRPRLGYVRC